MRAIFPYPLFGCHNRGLRLRLRCRRQQRRLCARGRSLVGHLRDATLRADFFGDGPLSISDDDPNRGSRHRAGLAHEHPSGGPRAEQEDGSILCSGAAQQPLQRVPPRGEKPDVRSLRHRHDDDRTAPRAVQRALHGPDRRVRRSGIDHREASRSNGVETGLQRAGPAVLFRSCVALADEHNIAGEREAGEKQQVGDVGAGVSRSCWSRATSSSSPDRGCRWKPTRSRPDRPRRTRSGPAGPTSDRRRCCR